MFYIFYTDIDGIQRWELVSGEDAMQIRVDELCREYSLDAEDVVVFAAEDELT